MIFDPETEETWPQDCQDVLVHGSETGFTVGTFYEHKDFGAHGPGFANWMARTGPEKDADFFCVSGETIQWWPLPAVDGANTSSVPDGTTDRSR